MKVDPRVPQLLIDYDYFCSRFDALDFGEFVILWHAADVIAESEIAASLERYESPETNASGPATTGTVH